MMGHVIKEGSMDFPQGLLVQYLVLLGELALCEHRRRVLLLLAFHLPLAQLHTGTLFGNLVKMRSSPGLELVLNDLDGARL